MRFDDRLSTVLRQSAAAPRDRAVQWRQLVELVARGAGATDSALLSRALARIAELGPEVPEAARITAARAIAASDVPLPLLRLFVADRGKVAAPLLGSVELSPAAWEELRSAASPGTRSIMETLRPPAVVPTVLADDGLDDVAAAAPSATVSPATPRKRRSDITQLFRWECGPEGEIDWVDGAVRAVVIGRSVRGDLKQRFDTMQPFLDEPLVLADEGDYAGEWRWSGRPQFVAGSGRFAGYAGVARRVPSLTQPQLQPKHDPVPPTSVALPTNHDDLRELIHELRTPLTAIIGFGEVIEGQYLGPAHRAYRDRAGEIVRQARLLLAAVEDLDLAAKLRSGRATVGSGAALADLARPLAGTVMVELRDPDVRWALEEGLARRLVERFVNAVVAGAGEGERLSLVVDRFEGMAALALERPEPTRSLDEAELLRSGGIANLGFALRLVRGLAQIVGGSLDIGPDQIVLLLPAV